MAAKPPKSSGNSPTTSTEVETTSDSTYTTQNENNVSIKSIEQKNLYCSCTNISIIQLFHEMKQKFPTVPDQVVHQCVLENCHNRENCIDCLRNELKLHPNTVQAYPSHVLRKNQNMGNKSLKLIRPIPKFSNHISKTDFDLMYIECNNHNDDVGINLQNSNSSNHLSVSSNLQNSKEHVHNKFLPKRPTTLALPELNCLHDNKNVHVSSFENSRCINNNRSIVHSEPEKCMQTSYKKKTYQSTGNPAPIHLPDSREPEISFNVSICPCADLSTSCPHPQRHRSQINLHPDAPYVKEYTTTGLNKKSFTSLNLTLRPPSTTPQLPIDITAGPSLTYSSSSYDAKRGYQKNFHITVTDSGGAFSASRVRPRSCYNNPCQYSDEEFNTDGINPLRTASSEQNFIYNGDCSLRDQPLFQDKDVFMQIIQRQKQRKDRLFIALMKNQNKLDKVRNGMIALTSPVHSGELKRLHAEIDKLRCDCEDILNKIEIARCVDNADDRNFHINRQHRQPFPRQRDSTPFCRLAHQSLHCTTLSPTTPIDQTQSSDELILPSTNSQESVENNNSADASNVDTDFGPPWPCSMCTFQNHPLLSKCEYCENVRIISGSIRIVSSSSSHLSNNPDSGGSSRLSSSSLPILDHMPHNLTTNN